MVEGAGTYGGVRVASAAECIGASDWAQGDNQKQILRCGWSLRSPRDDQSSLRMTKLEEGRCSKRIHPKSQRPHSKIANCAILEWGTRFL
jgi:hypothetical protein